MAALLVPRPTAPCTPGPMTRAVRGIDSCPAAEEEVAVLAVVAVVGVVALARPKLLVVAEGGGELTEATLSCPEPPVTGRDFDSLAFLCGAGGSGGGAADAADAGGEMRGTMLLWGAWLLGP